MRFLSLLLLALFLGTPAASAQIIAVHFTSEKAAKKFKKYLVEYEGEMVVIGEPRVGIRYIAKTNTLSYQLQKKNELFVVDPRKPELPAYYLVDGEKEPTGKKNVLSIQGHQIDRLSMLSRDQSLPGLSREYQLKVEEIDRFREERDGLDTSTSAWLAAHHRLVTTLEKFEGWITSVGFTGVLKGVQKDLKKERKGVQEAALATRAKKAIDSVKVCEVPEELQAVSDEHYEGHHKFGAVESQHFRMYYLSDGNIGDGMTINESQALGALKLAERILDGFRAEFIDPYVDEGYVDQIPEGLFALWLFVPDADDVFVKYASSLYSYKRHPGAESMETIGATLIGGFPRHHRFLWRLEPIDLDGTICHQMGHVLAYRHYGSPGGGLEQAWLSEAVGDQISYQYIGRKTVFCFGMKEKPTYLKREVPKPGEKTMAVGRRAIYNEMALAQGSAMQQIAIKKLIEMNDADLAKSWSFYDYITREGGKPGQQWLRAAGRFSNNPKTFIEKWRAAAAEILGVSERQAFAELEARWRKYAETEQLNASK